MRQRVGAGDTPAGRADDRGQLALEVERLRDGGLLDGLIGADEAGGGSEEQRRLVDRRPIHLVAMRGVVDCGTEHAAVGDRGQALEAGGGKPLAVAGRIEQRLGPRPGEDDDALAVHAANGGNSVPFESDELHGKGFYRGRAPP